MDGHGIPIPDCAPPAYITGFCSIRIKFVDQEVVQFLTHISECIMANKGVTISVRIGKLNANHCAFVDQLLHIFREERAKIHLGYHCPMASIPSRLPEMELQICIFPYKFKEEVDMPILIKMLASPRADGRQCVFNLVLSTDDLALKVIDAIKQDFRASTQQLPQPFYIRFRLKYNNNLNWPIGIFEEEENEQTNESLVAFGHDGESINEHLRQRYFTICRHPKGQHEKWAEDAASRVQPAWVAPNQKMRTMINVEL